MLLVLCFALALSCKVFIFKYKFIIVNQLFINVH
jgi:hypothetical protein